MLLDANIPAPTVSARKLTIPGQHFSTIPTIRKIAFLGDYLPRKCGIATFTTDLRCAVAGAMLNTQCPVVPVNDGAAVYNYPREVRFEIAEQDLPSYLRAADFLNITDVDVICVQHEFGIFGGPAGSHLLALLRELSRMSFTPAECFCMAANLSSPMP